MYKRKSANELRKEYEVYANFYITNIKGIGKTCCRNVADIVRIGTSIESSIDCYCVMMNPGSCKPFDRNYKLKKTSPNSLDYIKAKDDPAQRQIMNLMKLQNWNHVRLLNLSDIISGNSNEHRKLVNKAKEEKYSIFSNNRKEELTSLIKKKAPFILSWGQRDELYNDAIRAKKRLKNKEIIGIPFDDEEVYYRYIKPYKWDDCDKMIVELNKIINK